MSTPEVLIVGGGAVGTLLACDLLGQGIRVRIVESRPSLDDGDPHSRAVMIWPRVLELLEKTGITEELIARGRPAHDVSFFAKGRRLATIPLQHLDAAHPFGLGIDQRELEDLLRKRLAELGGTIGCGTALTGLDNSGELPRVTLTRHDGVTEHLEVPWPAGADGAGSLTRRLLDIAYPGLPFPLGISLGDFPVEGPVVSGVEYHYGPTGLLPLVHLPDGVCRLATVVTQDEEDWAERPLADWQEMVDQRSALPYRLGEALWKRTYFPRPGVAERFRDGRVLLVGDAAHSVVPLGGQGLNLGLQDALNLGWKLAGVVRGAYRASLLDTYDRERRDAVEQVRTVIRTEMDLSAPQSPEEAERRNEARSAAEASGFLRKVAAPLMSQTGLSYAQRDEPLWRTPLHRRPAAGDRVPFHHTTRRDPGAPLLSQSGHLALLRPGEHAGPQWHAVAGTAAATIRPHAAVHDLAALGDRTRRDLLGRFGPRAVIALVRPDGHLDALVPAHRPQECVDRLARLAPRPDGRK